MLEAAATSGKKEDRVKKSKREILSQIVKECSLKLGHLSGREEHDDNNNKQTSRINVNTQSKQNVGMSMSRQGNSLSKSVSAFVKDGQIYLSQDNDNDDNTCCTWLHKKCRQCAEQGFQYLFALALLFVLATILFIDEFVEFGKDHKINKLRIITRDLSHGVMDTSSTCARQKAYNPNAPIALPSTLSKAFKQIRKLHSSHQSTYNTYMDIIVANLHAANCTAATMTLGSLMSMFMTDELSNDHAELIREDDLVMAWNFALSQLNEEGHFHFDINGQLSSSYGLDGVAANLMCSPIMQMYWQNALPAIFNTLYCPEDYLNEVTSDIQLHTNVKYHLPLNGIMYMIQAAWRNKTFETSLLKEYAGILIEMFILMFICALSIAIMTRTIINTRHALQERVMIEKDFYIDGVKVAVKPETLCLLDLYCWKLGNLEEVCVEEVLQFIAERNDSQYYRERNFNPLDYFNSPRQSQLQTTNTFVRNITNSGNNNNTDVDLSRVSFESSHLVPFTPQGANANNYNNGNSFSISDQALPNQNIWSARTKIDKNNVNLCQGIVPFLKARSLQAHAASRRRRLRQFFKEYEQFDSATQIQFQLHRIVHPLLLLKPFVPDVMLREFVYSEYDHANLGPALLEVKKTTVLQDGLESDAVVYVFVSFRRFNTNETLTRATQHFIDIDERRQRESARRAGAMHKSRWNVLHSWRQRGAFYSHNTKLTNTPQRGKKMRMRRSKSIDSVSGAGRGGVPFSHDAHTSWNVKDNSEYDYITRWTNPNADRLMSFSGNMARNSRSTELPHAGNQTKHSSAFYMRGLSSLFYNNNTTKKTTKQNKNGYNVATDVTIMNVDHNANHEDLLDVQRPLGARLLGNTGGAIGEWKFLQRHKMMYKAIKKNAQIHFTFAKSNEKTNNTNNNNNNNNDAALPPSSPNNKEKGRSNFENYYNNGEKEHCTDDLEEEMEELEQDECYGHYGDEYDNDDTDSSSGDSNDDSNNNVNDKNNKENSVKKDKNNSVLALLRRRKRKQAKRLRQPLSLVASGLNYILAYTRYAARVFHGQVVQISSDGILLQFREGDDAEDEDHHCLHTREVVEELAQHPSNNKNLESNLPFTSNSAMNHLHHNLLVGSTSSSSSPSSTMLPLKRLGGNKMVIDNKIYYLSKEERAVRAAHFIQQSLDRSLDFAENRYTPQELLHCPIMVLADNAALRGRLRFHVSRHYSVLSPCVPLFFPLEEICMEYNVGLLITEDVFECAENAIIARPFHFMDIGDLNSYYFMAQQNQERFRARRVEARLAVGYGTALPKKEFQRFLNNNNTINSTNTEFGSANNNNNNNKNNVEVGPNADSTEQQQPEQPQRQSSQSNSLKNNNSTTGSNNNSSNNNNNNFNSGFAMKGSLYEVLSTRRVTMVSESGESSAEGEGRNQARHDHWQLIWEKYIQILEYKDYMYLFHNFARYLRQQEWQQQQQQQQQQDKQRQFRDRVTQGNRESLQTDEASSLDDTTLNLSSCNLFNSLTEGMQFKALYNSVYDKLLDCQNELMAYRQVYGLRKSEEYSFRKVERDVHEMIRQMGTDDDFVVDDSVYM